MLSLIMIVCAVIIMSKAAEMEGRSSVIWGALTLMICFASAYIPLPLLNILIGLGISFAAMFVMNLIRKD